METIPFVVNPAGVLNLSDEELFRLCAANPELFIERTSHGELIFMAPAGGTSSNRNSLLNRRLGNWNEETGLGVVFDSSGGFILPNGAMRAPDAAWIPKAKWEALSPEQREQFPPLCPDFVIELRSRTDRLRDLQGKMAEYVASGCRLGWLIDPYERQAHIYRPQQDVEVAGFDGALSGEDVLPGFTLDLALVDTAAS
ncbi:MAG: Uma2 family endonuclease [Rhodothermales bacterium]